VINPIHIEPQFFGWLIEIHIIHFWKMMGWLSSWYFPPQKIPEEKPPGILDISGFQVVAGCVVHYCKVGTRGAFHPAVNIPNMNRMEFGAVFFSLFWESTDGDGKSWKISHR
jgi:hypothetical protein